MTVKINFLNEIMSQYCSYLSPVSECSDQTRATFTVSGREKNVINEGAHIMHLFLSTYLPLFVLGST